MVVLVLYLYLEVWGGKWIFWPEKYYKFSEEVKSALNYLCMSVGILNESKSA
jgi:hypothetical protein